MLPHIWKVAYKECFAAAAEFCNYLQFSGKFLSSNSKECAYDDMKSSSSWVKLTNFKM